MSGNIKVMGTLTAVAGIERAHATEREYPFTMHKGDTLKIGDRIIHFAEDHTFNDRAEQDRYVEEH